MIPTVHAVALVIAYENGYVLIQEAKERVYEKWSLPGGMREAGESILESAVRETEEEAGILVEPTGIIHIEHQLWTQDDHVERLRWILYAKYVSGTLKKTADAESLQAAVYSLSEMEQLDLRDSDTVRWIKAAQEERVTPLSYYSFGVEPNR